MKAVRIIISLLLVAGTVLYMAVPVFAMEKEVYGYYIKESDLSENVRKYISSVYLGTNSEGCELFIDGKNLGKKEGNPVSYSYSPNPNTDYVFTFDLESKTASAYYQNSSEEKVVSIFSFSITDAVQEVSFLSDADAAAVKRTAVKTASGYYDFGTFSFLYPKEAAFPKSQEISFSLKVNAGTNTAIITRGGKEYTYSLDGTGKYETVYCENLVEAHELDLGYLESSLEKKSYPEARVVHYSDSDIDRALAGETIELINNKTGLKTSVALRRTITYWARKNNSDAVGDGSYDEYETKVQVVCQWDEDLCASVRNKISESERPFAVYGSSTEYSYVGKEEKKGLVRQYENISWPEYSYTGPVKVNGVYGNLDDAYGVVQFRTAPSIWGQYSAWKGYTNAIARECDYSDACSYETRTAYAYKMRYWNDWSAYEYTSCTPGGDTQCRSALLYARRTRSWQPWSDYVYSGLDTLACSAAGSLLGSTCEREAKTLYAMQTGSYSSWSDVTSWAPESCISSDTKSCESKTWYAYRTIGPWSGWSEVLSCSPAYTSSGGSRNLSLKTKECRSETQTRKRTRTIAGYTYSGYTDGLSSHGYSSQCTSSSKSSSLCGQSYSYGGSSASKYGSYQSACLSVYTTDAQCGTSYTSYTETTSPHGYTEACTTTQKQSSSCGTQNKSCTVYRCATSRTENYKSCRTEACGVESYKYSSYSKSTEAHGWTDSCTTSYEQNSLCGTNVFGGIKKCTIYNCASGRSVLQYKSCTNKACGVMSTSYSSYTTTTSKHGYTETCTSSTERNSLCGTEYATCTFYNCPTGKTTNTCYLYQCPTGVSNKTCTIYSCPTVETPYYSSWSSWSAWGTAACTSGTYTDCDSRLVNFARTRSWNNWTGYSYLSASADANTDYISRVETRYKTRTFTFGNYSGYIYDSCTESDTVNCRSTTLYRKRDLGGWGEWSGYSYSSCDVTDTQDCKKETMYSVRTLGSWSSLKGVDADGLYIESSCIASDMKECYEQRQIRTKERSFGSYGGWSENYRTLEDIPYDSRFGYEYRYSNGVLVKESTKGASEEIGKGSVFVRESSVYKDITTAVPLTRSYTTSSRMTASEINAFASKVAEDAGESLAVSTYISSSSDMDEKGARYITWDFWEDNAGLDYRAADAARERFLLEKRFIPYIFITRHFRATNKKFFIEGYDNESISVNSFIDTSTSSISENIPLYPDEVVTYEYCELNPDADECYCVNNPGALGCSAAEPEKDFCELNPLDETCFCSTYPMSERCRTKERDTAVIYLSYLDPLENYKDKSMPDNWKAYENLVEEIKMSDLSLSETMVRISAQDLKDMRKWLDEHPEKHGSCEMLRKFSYIFVKKSPELEAWLRNGNGCRTNQ